jgi:hypothetical protein
MELRRYLGVVLALGVIAAASVWVSAVRFKDEASAWDCGVPLGAAGHGREAPNLPELVPTPHSGPVAQVGLFGIPKGASAFVTVCQGEARTRVAIAAAAIVAAVGGVLLSRRRWVRSPPAVTPA